MDMEKQNLKGVKYSGIIKELIRTYEMDPTPTDDRPDYRSCIGDDRFKIMYFRSCNTALNYDTRSGKIIDEGVRFLAHCDGLFCIAIAGEILLWNPSTKQARKLPPPEIDDPRDCDRATLSFGLGYDSSSDDYKLVSICVIEALEMATEVKVYSRNRGTWQRIPDFPYAFPLLKPGVYARGYLYWRVGPWRGPNVGGFTDAIVALDMANNSYSAPPVPNVVVGPARVQIGVLGDQLVAYFNCATRIWILKEHGSWSATDTKMSSCFGGWLETPLNLDCNKGARKQYYEPMCLMKNPGLVLLRIAAGEVAVFDMEKNEGCEEYYKIPVDEDMDFRMVGFLESLASPYADVAQQQEEESPVVLDALSKMGTMTLQAQADVAPEQREELKKRIIWLMGGVESYRDENNPHESIEEIEKRILSLE